MSDNLSVGSLYPPNEQTGIAFKVSNRPTVLLITSDGRLEKGPGYSTEEAAQVLFDAVSDHIAGIWKQTCDENAALRKDVAEMKEIDESEAAIAADTIKVLKAENAALRAAGNVLCTALEAELQAYVRVLEMFEDDDLSHAKELEATISQWKNGTKP